MTDRTLRLDGESLTVADLVRVARHPAVQVEIAPEVLQRVERCADLVQKVGKKYEHDHHAFERGDTGHEKVPTLDYGISTGFGDFKSIPIRPEDLALLQENILKSHATGVGDDSHRDNLANYFPAEVVRAALVIRLNCFLKGHSGVRPQLVDALGRMLNRGIVPLVPLHGSVGSSGDLCPLSHLFVVLIGEGRYYMVSDAAGMRPRPETIKSVAWVAEDSPKGAGRTNLDQDLATEADPDYKLEHPRVSYKEGLALTNGTNFSAAMLALGVHDAEMLANTADVAAAMSLEAVSGCARAFDDRVHKARNLRGQRESAGNIRKLLLESKLIERSDDVQDAYSLRCAPAVHGATRDAIAYAHMVAFAEINAATDNPLFFPPESGDDYHATDPWDLNFKHNWEYRTGRYDGERRASYSAGNFHGQPVGQAADFLAIAVAELADIAERRTQTLLDRHHNRGLPGNLIPWAGRNTGFMVSQYAAAGLVSENKILAHPATVDSIPTSANSEDHVAMATAAARKLGRVLRNSQATLAIELLCAAQALEWRETLGNRFRKEASRWNRELGELERQVRACASANDEAGYNAALRTRMKRVSELADEMKECFEKVLDGGADQIAGSLGTGTGAAYKKLRSSGVETMLEDRMLDEPIRRVRELVESGSLLEAVNAALRAAEREGPDAGELAPIRAIDMGIGKLDG